MKFPFWTIYIVFLLYFPFSQVLAQDLAFPGAQGWAAITKGGRGGKIIKVTTLNKDGKGSLRSAIEMEEPRIIVFEAGGIIDMEGSSITIKNPYITIMGQTAPDPGITIIKGGDP